MQHQRRQLYRPSIHKTEIPEKANRVLNLILIAMVLIILRSWHLGIIQYEERLEESRKPQRRVIVEPSKRATIRDRFNIPLAINKVQYQAAIQYSQFRQIPSVRWEKDAQGKKIKRQVRKEYIKKLSELLGKVLQLDPERIEDLIHSKASFYYSIPFVIKEDIGEKEYYALKMLEKDWAGIHVQRMPRRFYPKGKVGADIIGYLGAINRQEYETIIQEIKCLESYIEEREAGEDPPLPQGINTPLAADQRLRELKEHAYTINDYVGKTGIEGKFEQDLRGFHGKKRYYSDARGNFLRELPGSREPLPGKRLLLTISSELQEFAEKLLIQNEKIREFRVTGVDAIHQTLLSLKHPWIKGGAIVAMDPHTGEILALATIPRFDPNDFIVSGNPEISKRKHSNISRWFENEIHLSEIWDQKRALERERYDDHMEEFYEEKLSLSWENFLNIVLPKHSSIRGVLDRMESINEAIELQNEVEQLLELTGNPSVYWLFNILYAEAPHQPYGSKMNSETEASIKEHIQEHLPEVNRAKQKIDRWIGRLYENYDKALVVDLCRLAVQGDQFKKELLEHTKGQTLSFYRQVNSSYVILLEAMRGMVKELFHELHFKPWINENGKEYLQKKRLEEKANKQYPKPYIDYYDKLEQSMFQQFWKEHQQAFLLIFLTGKILDKPATTDLQYFEHFSTWHKELENGAHTAMEWYNAYKLLQESIKKIPPELSIQYFKTLRSYEDLTRPLLGQYRHLRKTNNQQLEKNLAAAFYPMRGYGYGRSQAYRQAATQGSIFKLVTSYEALIQRYKKIGKKNVTAADLNPLEITDQIFRHGKNLCVAYTNEGKPIPQIYKGGRLLKSHSKCLGKMDLIKALETSSNPYFSLLAGDILESPEDLANAAKKFSYGSQTGIDLPGEISGKIPSDIVVNRTGLYAMANGQHSLVVTPLQSCVMMSSIANGGKILKPKIVKLTAGKQPWRKEEEILSSANLNQGRNKTKAGFEFPTLTAFENSVDENFVQRTPTIIKDKLFMPGIVQRMLLEGMHRVVIKQCKDGLSGLSKLYKDHPEAISDYLELKDQLMGKTSTSEAMEYLDLDLKHGVNMYNHVWFGGIAYHSNLTKTENETLIYSDKLGNPELVVIVYLRYGAWGKETAPLGAQVVKKWREIKMKAKNPDSENLYIK